MDVPQLTPAELDALHRNMAVLDVREPGELAGGQIPGSTNIPLGQLPARLGELERGRPVVVVCRSGRRSQHAAEMLTAAGFVVGNLAGGIDGWVRDGRPTAVPSISRSHTLPGSVIHSECARNGGPDPADLSRPRLLDPAELARRLLLREWVVDVRPRAAFAAAHLPGALNVELGDDFAACVGRLYDLGSPLTLIAETRTQIAEARRRLLSIGIDQINGAAIGRPDELTDGRPLVSHPVTDFAGLAQAMAAGTPIVLDVRRHDERALGGVRGSLHIPLDQLRGLLARVPLGEVSVYSASGYRASVAVSLLARVGYHPILVDGRYADPDTGAAAVGLHSAPAPADRPGRAGATGV